MRILRRKNVMLLSSAFLVVVLLLVGLAKSVDLGVFAQNEHGSYQLFFNLNGWEWGGSVQTLDCGTDGPSTGCEVTLPNGPSSTNQDSYVFVGWADSADATDVQYSAGSSFHIPRQDTTLYAVYEVTTLNYFIYNGNTAKSVCRKTVGSSVCQVQLKTYEQMIAEGLPERQGYTFLGWSSTSGATSAQYQPGELYTVAPAAGPLYGVWAQSGSTTPSVNTFTLSFDANADGDTVNNLPQTQTGSSSENKYTFTVPTTTPTRQGYTFVAWVENVHSSEGINPGDQITVGNTSGTIFTKTLYAVWRANNTFTLSFDANADGDTVNNLPQTQTGSSSENKYTFTVPTTTPTRQGYTFVAWVENVHSSEGINPGDQITVGNTSGTIFTKTLYAVWRANNTFTLSFDANADGDTVNNLPQTQTGSSSENKYTFTVPTTTPTRQGYTFVAWVENVHSSEGIHPGDQITVGNTSGTIFTKTLYAVWRANNTFTLSFDANADGDTVNNLPQTQTGSSSENKYTFTVPTTTPTRQGYTFVAWVENIHSSEGIHPGDQITVGNTSGTIFTKTLYAVWRANNTFTLSFDANADGDTVNNLPQTQTGSSSENKYTFTVPTTTPTRQGYTFVAWVENVHSSEGIHPGDQITVGNTSGTIFTKTLYAVWRANSTYTLTLSAIDGTLPAGVETTLTCTPATAGGSCEVTIPVEAVPTKEGYTFKGWAQLPHTTHYNPGDNVSIDADLTLYAMWEANPTYTLTYNANGGSYVSPNVDPVGNECTVNSGTTCSVLLTTQEPSRTGYTFKGWARSSSATTPEYVSPTNGTVELSDNMTLYAVWEMNEIDNGIIDSDSIIKYTIGSGEPIVIKSRGGLDGLTGLKIDGVVVPVDQYIKTSEDGQTVVTIPSEYLDNLPVGNHTATLVWGDSEVDVNFVVERDNNENGGDDGTNTGDNGSNNSDSDDKSGSNDKNSNDDNNDKSGSNDKSNNKDINGGNDGDDNRNAIPVPSTSAGTPDTGENTGNNIGGNIAVMILPVVLAGLATLAYRRNINKTHRKFD